MANTIFSVHCSSLNCRWEPPKIEQMKSIIPGGWPPAPSLHDHACNPVRAMHNADAAVLESYIAQAAACELAVTHSAQQLSERIRSMPSATTGKRRELDHSTHSYGAGYSLLLGLVPAKTWHAPGSVPDSARYVAEASLWRVWAAGLCYWERTTPRDAVIRRKWASYLTDDAVRFALYASRQSDHCRMCLNR